MFKALVLTQKLIKHPHSTLNRQIISQIKQQVQYSPAKSPSKPLQSPSSSAQNSKYHKSSSKPQQGSVQKAQSSSQKALNSNQKNPIFPFKLTEIQGTLKLFHQYQLQRIQDNFNQLIIEKKRQEIATLAHLKTNILAIINVTSLKDKQTILKRLAQVKEEIDTVDLFVQKRKYDEKDTQKEQKSKQSSFSLQVSFSIVVYFHTSLMSQEFYKLCYKEFMHLPVYLKQVIILQRSSSEEISYKQVLSSFSYIEPMSHQQQNKLQLSQKDINWLQGQQRKWIELPKCPNCLLKLEFEVSGIDQNVLYLIGSSQNQKQQDTQKKTNQKCLTCQILSSHRKQGEIHRKLSSSSDHKDHTKPNQIHAHCDDCKQKSDIWICMVCSRVGCGRYKNADAQKHFVKSGHILTIDLETERVWNYMSDCFSHKLLKNFNESTSVKFPDISKDESEKIEQSKLEAAFWQYCSVFSEEMERQRIFYENIKLSEEEKFHQQVAKLDMIIKQLQKQTEQKSLQLKRTLKKKSKLSKKQKEIQEKVAQQREILKEHEQCIGADWVKNFLENDEDIKRKKKELQELEIELSQVLVQLSSS